MDNFYKRVLSGLFGLLMTIGGAVLMVNQATGKGIDLDQDKWSINLVPGEFIVLMLVMVPMMIGVYLVIYAIRGR